MTLKAGRALDTIVGTGIFDLDSTKQHLIPPYSTDFNFAFQVVEKLRNNGFWFELKPPVSYSLDFECHFQLNDIDETAISSSGPEAICLAALKALRIYQHLTIQYGGN